MPAKDCRRLMASLTAVSVRIAPAADEPVGKYPNRLRYPLCNAHKALPASTNTQGNTALPQSSECRTDRRRRFLLSTMRRRRRGGLPPADTKHTHSTPFFSPHSRDYRPRRIAPSPSQIEDQMFLMTLREALCVSIRQHSMDQWMSHWFQGITPSSKGRKTNSTG